MGLTYKQDVFSSHRNSTLTDQNIDSKSWVASIHQSLQGTLQDGFVSPKMFVSGPKRLANLKPPIPDRPGGDVPIKAKGLHSSPSPYLWFFHGLFIWYPRISFWLMLSPSHMHQHSSSKNDHHPKWSTLINPHEANILHYPLVNVYRKLWEITMFNGKNSL